MKTPPHLADRLLRLCCAPHLQEEVVLGDLHECYVVRVKSQVQPEPNGSTGSTYWLT